MGDADDQLQIALNQLALSFFGGLPLCCACAASKSKLNSSTKFDFSFAC